MERRSHARVNVYPLCRVRFRVGPATCRNIRVVDLSEDGCRIHVPLPAPEGLKDSTDLENWKLSLSGLPRETIKARVAWCRPGPGAGSRFMVAGVKFLDLPASWHPKVAAFVERASHDSTPFLDLTGMPD